MTACVIAADLGAGSLRVAAISPDGRELSLATVPLAADEPFPGWAELDAETWWQGLAEATAKVLARLPKAVKPAALCLSGLTRSQVLLDHAGRVLRPAILFRDRRAADDAAAVASHFLATNPADAITAFHPLARLSWVARCEADVFERLGLVLEPKDFLAWRLTGQVSADAVTYSRFDALEPQGGPLPGWLDRCRRFLDLPRPLPWEQIGRISATTAPFDRLAGLPVFAGAMDTWTAATGSGALSPGQAYDVAGTSEVVGLLSRTRAATPGLLAMRWGDDLYQLGGPTQAGADCASWAHQSFRCAGRLDAAVERAGRIPPSDDLPLFLPYLAGERTPVWRSDVRGAFFGLGRTLGPDEFLWSVLEGVAHAVRDILDMAAAGCGARVSEMRVSGGGARSDAWCQLKADVSGVPVVRAAHEETGLIGAAMAATVGLGIHADLAAAAAAMCPVDAVFEPQAPLKPFYDRRAALYQRVKATALDLAGPAAVPAPPQPKRQGNAS